MEFGLMIKDIRQQCYLSQQAFADEIGVGVLGYKWDSRVTIYLNKKIKDSFRK